MNHIQPDAKLHRMPVRTLPLNFIGKSIYYSLLTKRFIIHHVSFHIKFVTLNMVFFQCNCILESVYFVILSFNKEYSKFGLENVKHN